MKLPLIKAIAIYSDEHNKDDITATIAVLEHISQARGLKPEELDLIGELLSNLYGAVEVTKMVEEGQTQGEALNGFMKRVLGSIN